MTSKTYEDIQGRDFSDEDCPLALLSGQFDEQPEMESYTAPPPEWARHIKVSYPSS
jgi:hypothetical protein